MITFIIRIVATENGFAIESHEEDNVYVTQLYSSLSRTLTMLEYLDIISKIDGTYFTSVSGYNETKFTSTERRIYDVSVQGL